MVAMSVVDASVGVTAVVFTSRIVTSMIEALDPEMASGNPKSTPTLANRLAAEHQGRGVLPTGRRRMRT